MDADAAVLVVSSSRESEFLPVRTELYGFAVACLATDYLLDRPGCKVVQEDRVGSWDIPLGSVNQ